jgi:hypothetical protein
MAVAPLLFLMKLRMARITDSPVSIDNVRSGSKRRLP